MALKTLTLLFIGGASSASELLSCQSVDGGAADFCTTVDGCKILQQLIDGLSVYPIIYRFLTILLVVLGISQPSTVGVLMSTLW